MHLKFEPCGVISQVCERDAKCTTELRDLGILNFDFQNFIAVASNKNKGYNYLNPMNPLFFRMPHI